MAAGAPGGAGKQGGRTQADPVCSWADDPADGTWPDHGAELAGPAGDAGDQPTEAETAGQKIVN